MKVASGVVLVAVMFLLLYMAITGKIDCFAGAFRCAFLGGAQPGDNSKVQTKTPITGRPGITVDRGVIRMPPMSTS